MSTDRYTVKIYPTSLPRGWDDEAFCKGSDTDPDDWVFDPGHGVGPSKLHRRLKKQYCDRCHIRKDCKKFGVETHSTGLFGGVFLDDGQVVK